MKNRLLLFALALWVLLVIAIRWSHDSASVSWHSTPRGYRSARINWGCSVLWLERRPDLIRLEWWPNRNQDAVPWAVGFDALEGKPILQRRKPIKAQP
jgi:hypothetical protein